VSDSRRSADHQMNRQVKFDARPDDADAHGRSEPPRQYQPMKSFHPPRNDFKNYSADYDCIFLQ